MNVGNLNITPCFPKGLLKPAVPQHLLGLLVLGNGHFSGIRFFCLSDQSLFISHFPLFNEKFSPFQFSAYSFYEEVDCFLYYRITVFVQL